MVVIWRSGGTGGVLGRGGTLAEAIAGWRAEDAATAEIGEERVTPYESRRGTDGELLFAEVPDWVEAVMETADIEALLSGGTDIHCLLEDLDDDLDRRDPPGDWGSFGAALFEVARARLARRCPRLSEEAAEECGQRIEDELQDQIDRGVWDDLQAEMEVAAETRSKWAVVMDGWVDGTGEELDGSPGDGITTPLYRLRAVTDTEEEAREIRDRLTAEADDEREQDYCRPECRYEHYSVRRYRVDDYWPEVNRDQHDARERHRWNLMEADEQ